jgi:hypothetical protein
MVSYCFGIDTTSHPKGIAFRLDVSSNQLEGFVERLLSVVLSLVLRDIHEMSSR